MKCFSFLSRSLSIILHPFMSLCLCPLFLLLYFLPFFFYTFYLFIFIHFFSLPSTHPSLFLSSCSLSIHLSLSASLSFFLFISLSIYLSISPPFPFSLSHLPPHPSFSLCVSLIPLSLQPLLLSCVHSEVSRWPRARSCSCAVR